MFNPIRMVILVRRLENGKFSAIWTDHERRICEANAMDAEWAVIAAALEIGQRQFLQLTALARESSTSWTAVFHPLDEIRALDAQPERKTVGA